MSAEDLRTYARWTLVFSSPVISLFIIAYPPTMVPAIIVFIGLLAWLRPRSE